MTKRTLKITNNKRGRSQVKTKHSCQKHHSSKPKTATKKPVHSKQYIEKIAQFRTLLSSKVYEAFGGKSIKLLSADEQQLLKTWVNAATKQVGLRKVPGSEVIRQILLNQQRKHLRSGKEVLRVSLGAKAQTVELQIAGTPESQIITRSKICLPCPGLVKPPKPISYIDNNENFPIYAEKDCLFDLLATQLIENQPRTSPQECDYVTPIEEVDYFIRERAEQTDATLLLVSIAPDFNDRRNDIGLIFSWRHICQQASIQGVPPFNLLAFAAIMKHNLLDNNLPDYSHIKINSMKYSDISPIYPPMSLPFTCPLEYLLHARSLREQMFLVNSIYEKFLLGAQLVDSHALFLEFARRDVECGEPFSRSIQELDSTRIQLMENQIFCEYERSNVQYSSYCPELSILLPIIVEIQDDSMRLIADESIENFNYSQQDSTRQHSQISENYSHQGPRVLTRQRVFLDAIQNASNADAAVLENDQLDHDAFMREGPDSDVDQVVDISTFMLSNF